MRAFGTPTVVNPFDRFGDHLRLALRAPATYQLIMWLESGPGAPLPERGRPPTEGRWVLCGYGRFGQKLAADLRAEGLTVTAVDPAADPGEDDVVVGDGSDPDVMARADLADRGRVRGRHRQRHHEPVPRSRPPGGSTPTLFVAARQNRPANAPLFEAMESDALLVLTEVVAHEVYAKLSTPLLWRFLQEVPAQGDEWAAELIDRMRGRCGHHLRTLWTVRLSAASSPALRRWLASGEARPGDLLRSPHDRDRPLAAVVRVVLRGDEYRADPGRRLPAARRRRAAARGGTGARRALDTTLIVDATREYVVTGRYVPSGWIWRKLSSLRDGADRS